MYVYVRGHSWAWLCVWGVTKVGGSLLCTRLPTLQAKNERNYHIFYELLAGLPAHLRQAFSLQEAETYYYLNQVSTCKHLKLQHPWVGPGSPAVLS